MASEGSRAVTEFRRALDEGLADGLVPGNDRETPLSIVRDAVKRQPGFAKALIETIEYRRKLANPQSREAKIEQQLDFARDANRAALDTCKRADRASRPHPPVIAFPSPRHRFQHRGRTHLLKPFAHRRHGCYLGRRPLEPLARRVRAALPRAATAPHAII